MQGRAGSSVVGVSQGEDSGRGCVEIVPDHVGLVGHRRDFGFHSRRDRDGTQWQSYAETRHDLTLVLKGSLGCKIDMYTLLILCIKWLTNENLLYTTGNSTPGSLLT